MLKKTPEIRRFGESGVWWQLSGVFSTKSSNENKRVFRAASWAKWKSRWAADNSAAWTHELILDRSVYLNHLSTFDFFLSQALSGHQRKKVAKKLFDYI